MADSATATVEAQWSLESNAEVMDLRVSGHP